MNSVRNAFSIDIEDYFHVSAFESVVDRRDWGSLPSRVVGNTERLLGVLAEHNITATLFVLAWVAERHPELIRSAAQAGHEIACHGYSHQRAYRQTEAVFREETLRAKHILEDCIGQPVVGYRAASFSVTEQSQWVLDVLLDAGFQYDSSIYPIRHDNYGMPSAKTTPGLLQTPSGRTIIEFPLSTVNLLGVSVPVGGGGYFRLYPYWLTRRLLGIIGRRGQPINFYCHPWELDTQQPRFEGTPWKSRFRHYNNIDRFETRLRKLLAEFNFTTCCNVLGDLELIDWERAQHASA